MRDNVFVLKDIKDFIVKHVSVCYVKFLKFMLKYIVYN